MVWNAASPDGTISAKANRPQMNANNTYIQTTMGDSIVGTNAVTTRDHFWNVGANEDGRHRFVQSPAFTVGAIATDPVIGTGMDGVFYLKTTNSRAEWFHRNSAGIYQAVPSFLSGTVSITSTNTFVNITTVPANVYGDIYIYKLTNDATPANSLANIQCGTFVSNNNTVHAFSDRIKIEGTSDDYLVELENDATTDLNIRVRRNVGPSGTWNYRITYRAL